jgi:nucleoid-associated protein YgaU
MLQEFAVHFCFRKSPTFGPARRRFDKSDLGSVTAQNDIPAGEATRGKASFNDEAADVHFASTSTKPRVGPQAAHGFWPRSRENESNLVSRLAFVVVVTAVLMVFSAYLMIKTNHSANAELAPIAYTIVPGDTLTKLAARFYGSATEWKRIYAANRRALKTPNQLTVGVTLTIPSDNSERFSKDTTASYHARK